MSNKVKSRKCPDCGSRMTIRRSSSGKFWACSGYPDCKTTRPYYGDKPRSGLDLDIRQIDNGFVVSRAQKYSDNPDGDDPVEEFCKDKAELKVALARVFAEQVDMLCDSLDDSSPFDVDETAPAPKRQVPNGTTDVKVLLERAREASRKAKGQVAQEAGSQETKSELE
jgi:ssDNA-binding Zn-finger/Zn-ribbon topoisomerase 1